MVRRCVFGCSSPRTLFTFPSDPWLRKRWLEFAHLEESGIRSSSRICDRHFSDDCFNNLGLFNAGITCYLRLIENAVPSLYTVGAPPSATVSHLNECRDYTCISVLVFCRFNPCTLRFSRRSEVSDASTKRCATPPTLACKSIRQKSTDEAKVNNIQDIVCI